MLDMQLSDSGVVVLMAALNPNISQQLHYALGRALKLFALKDCRRTLTSFTDGETEGL